MPELIKMNGSAVNAINVYRREVMQPDGPALEEFQVAVMLRGRMTHRSFASLLEAGTITLEYGSHEPRETVVAAATVTSTGGGESAVYRHDFTLRETPASAARRAEEGARLAKAVAELNVLVADPDAAAKNGPVSAGEAVGEAEAELVLPVSTPSDTWATALRQLKGSKNGQPPRAESISAAAEAVAQPAPPPAPPVVMEAPQPVAAAPIAEPAPPAHAAPQPAPVYQAPPAPAADGTLSASELAGIEAVLVGLRLEAIIDALDRLQIVPRDEIEQAFVRLVQKRFVAEASLVVGEPVARRAARDILQGLGVGRWALGVGGDR